MKESPGVSKGGRRVQEGQKKASEKAEGKKKKEEKEGKRGEDCAEARE